MKVILLCEVMASVAHTKHKALWRRNAIYPCIYKQESARRAGGGEGGEQVYETHIRVKNESRKEVTR